jgi:hypothetical protein
LEAADGVASGCGASSLLEVALPGFALAGFALAEFAFVNGAGWVGLAMTCGPGPAGREQPMANTNNEKPNTPETAGFKNTDPLKPELDATQMPCFLCRRINILAV